MHDFGNIWVNLLAFFLMTGFLVTVHELGHYLVGRWCGIGATRFSLGMGPRLFGIKDKRGTDWSFSLLPVGGYVAFRQSTLADKEQGQDISGGYFDQASLASRFWATLAGPMFNFIASFIILFFVFLTVGEQRVEMSLGMVAEDSAAGRAGFQAGDVIQYAIVGDEITNFEDYRDFSKWIIRNPDANAVISYIRNGSENSTSLILGSKETEKGIIGYFGAAPEKISYIETGIVDSIILSIESCIDIGKNIAITLGKLLTGQIDFSNIGGMITIAKVSGDAFLAGVTSFAWMAALLSINLGIVNLLPIPVLDGGHIAQYGWEALTKKKPNKKFVQIITIAGMIFVVTFMGAALINDVVRFGWV